MAIVKFISSGCPMNNIFPYVMRDETTEQRLIDGINCSSDTALEEFRYVKQKYGEEDGRTYYHIVQSFSPEDDISPETAHEIGMKFAEYFPGFQIVVATHYNTDHVHNHLIMNSVNYENGKKFHQSRDELLQVKAYSNKLCREYGLSVTEEKCRYGDDPVWKKHLMQMALYAMSQTYTKEAFIEYMELHGYKVKWADRLKYITFTTPDGHVCRDKNLFDERLLKDNMEVYYALGGADTRLAEIYSEYETPQHHPDANMTITTGLVSLLGDLLAVAPPKGEYDPEMVTEMNPWERKRLERILGKKISSIAFACYSTQEEYEQEQGLGMYM